MINAAVVGLGTWGKTMVESLAGSDLMRFGTLQTRTVNADVEAFAKQHSLKIADSFEAVLADPKIDAVVLATPPSGHLTQIEAAAAAGKHVYCEKPMTHTVEQAIELRNHVRKHPKLMFTVGPQGTGNDSYWKAGEAIRAGRIGKVTWAQGSYNRNARICLFNEHQKIDPTAGPDKGGEDHIDWDMWLGHQWGLAPKRPWTPEHFFRFRKYWPYNGGVATDLLYHKLAPLLISLAGKDGAYPKRVSAGGGLYIEKDGRDIPDVFMLTADYPEEFTVFLVSTLTNDAQIPDRIYGKYGTMDVGGDPLLKANGDFFDEFKAKNGGEVDARIATEQKRDMEGQFIDAIRGKGPVHCNAELGAATMVAIKMAVESYRKSKTLTWDAVHERVREV